MSLKKLSWVVLSLLIISGMLLASCTPQATPTEAPPPPAEPTKEAPPPAEPTEAPPPPEPTEAPPPPEEAPLKSVTVTFFEEPDSLNNFYTSMWFAGLAIDFTGYGFWNFDDNQDFVLEMAAEVPTMENGGISEDGLIITIPLNEDAMWSDGTPVTADDYVFTYEMIMADGNTVQTRYPFDTYVVSVTALDDHTVQVVMNEPYVAWSIGLNAEFLPKHILEPIFEAEGTIDNADWNRYPVPNNGPFLLKEWEAASHLIFEANDNYWRGRPVLDQINIRVVPDDEAQMAAIKTGDTDLGVYMTAADKPEIDALENVDLVAVASGWVESWFFNLIDEELAASNNLDPGHVALQDVRVRKAIVMAVDRQQIIDELFYGLYKIPAVFWWDSIWEDTSIEPWPYDPTQAEALLDEAGWVDSNGDGTRDKDGVELVIRYSTTAGNELREATQVVVQQMLAEVGVGVEILNYSYDTIWNGYGDEGPVASGFYDIAEWSTYSWDFPDPNTGDWLCDEIPSAENEVGGNWQGVCIPELDELFALQAVTVDREERVQIFYEIERIMHEEIFWIGMRTDPDFWAVNNRLQNAILGGVDPFWNVYEWDVSE